jgi:AcrR family transcriptional regulator
MENRVPQPEPLARRTVERSLEQRYAIAEREVELLMRAAVRVVERDGAEEPKISDILREANLSNKAFYRHFRSKDELLITVLDDGLRRDLARIGEAMAEEPSPLAQIGIWIRGILARAGDERSADRTRPFVMSGLRLGGRFPEEWARTDDALQAPLRSAIAEALATGELREADPVRDARTIARLVLGELQSHLIHRRVIPPETVDGVVTFCLSGLRRCEPLS